MIFTGALKKMLTEKAEPIHYYLSLNEDFVAMQQVIGKHLRFQHIGNKCKGCGEDKPIFRMGFCKNCFFTVPEANPNILKPELSTAHLGIEQRDLEWEKHFELQPHVVYLAVSGGVKVGVTREVQIPTRWIDQGASKTIVVAKTNNRYEAGQIEVFLKQYYSDKTNWRKMLMSEEPLVDLKVEKQKVKSFLTNDLKVFYAEDDTLWEFKYPLERALNSVKSVKFNEDKIVEGVLLGIKGQYLIFEDETVFNVRANEGKVVSLKVQ